MKCPQCAAQNADDVAICAACGGPLIDLESGQTGVASATLPAPPPSATLVGAGAPPEQATFGLAGTPTLVDGPTHIVPPTQIPTGATPTRPGGSSAELPAGTLFANRYEILAVIGEGGMGRVYKVLDRELDRPVALKTLKTEPDEGGEALARFKQELLLARKITHKNVIRIHDLGEADGLKFFTMEFVEGDSLKGLIRARGGLPPEEALRLTRQILAALQEAHSQGVVHRDLKPQNVMVDAAGTPYLMDFGIARSVDATGMTATGAIVGTPDYMSPEQARGEKAGVASDIFSMGVILYELLTGDVPYKADTAAARIMMRLTTRARPLRELRPDLPLYLERVVAKCLESDVALRYQSVAELLADLDREQVDLGLTLRIQRAVVRHTALTATIVGVAVAAGGGVYLVTRQPGSAPVRQAAPAGPAHALAVLPFTNASGAAELEWLRSGLPEMLATDLSQSRYVRPVPSDRVYRVLQETGIDRQSRFDEAALERVAAKTHAQSVLSGQIVESGGVLRLDLLLRRAGAGVAVPLKVEGTAQDVLGLVDKISREVKTRLDLPPDQLASDEDRPLAAISSASLDAQRDYQAGLQAMRRGENQEAVAALQKAVAADPGFALALAKLAEAQLALGQDQEATASIGRARVAGEKLALPPAARFQIQATEALARDDAAAAVKAYTELARLYPEDPDVQMSLARAHKGTGDMAGALAAYKAAARLAPESGAALLGLGEVQVRSGHPDDAIASLRDALATKQFDAEPEALGLLHSIMGVAYRETGKLDQALEHLGQSLAIRTKIGDKRGQGSSLQNLASVYTSLGQPRKALAALDRALRLYRDLGNKPGESLILNAMGETYRDQGDLEKALGAFRESLSIELAREDHANMAVRLDQIADVYRRKGLYDDALIYLEQAKTHLAKAPEKMEQAVNLMYLGQVRAAQGLYKEALEALQGALPLYQEIGHQMAAGLVQLDLGRIYETQGRYGDAYVAFGDSLAAFQKLGIGHEVSAAQAALAHLLLAMGRVDEAEKALDAAEGGHAPVADAAHAEAGHGHDAAPEPHTGAHGGAGAALLLVRAGALEQRGKQAEAAKAYEAGNVAANLSGEKEVAVESRIALGRLYLAQGQGEAALRLLQRTREEAARSRLRPLEAKALAALAAAQLAQGQAEAARKSALDAIAGAEQYAGRPVQLDASATLAAALDALGRRQEAADAWSQTAASLEWLRGSLRPEHVESFVRRPDVQGLAARAAAALEAQGRGADAAPLKKWAARSS